MHSSFPKRIILSRKGWDSKAGGKPSAILPDGTFVSLPIPDSQSGICYDDLRMKNGTSLGPLVEGLTGKRIKGTDEVHLDPDLCAHAVKRAAFIPAFGQCGPAQGHLYNQNVRKESAAEEGDLFLFFGLYRSVVPDGTSWKYARKAPKVHAVFGWLQVGDVHGPDMESAPQQLARHPHVMRSLIVRNELGARLEDNNTLYIGRKQLSFLPNIAGAGMFVRFDANDHNDPRRLTNADNSCSAWRLPSFFESLSNMGKQPAPKNGWWYPQRRGPGQEFVLSTNGREREVEEWLLGVFKYGSVARAATK